MMNQAGPLTQKITTHGNEGEERKVWYLGSTEEGVQVTTRNTL